MLRLYFPFLGFSFFHFLATNGSNYFNRPGRRPGDTPNRASFLPKRFFSTGDEIRGLIRVPCEEAQLLFLSFLRRGYINGHDRSNNTRVRFYIRRNTTLDQFVLSLPKRLTSLDRFDAGWVPPEPSLYARGFELADDFQSERRSLLIPMAMGLPISLGSSIPFPMIPLSSVVMVSDAGVGITFMMMLIFNVTK